MYKHLYKRFLGAYAEWLHFAAHSHYFWPDATRDGQVQYWDDSSRMADDKWGYIFRNLVPSVQESIAERIGTDSPSQIVFAPNTHELVSRVLSCFATERKIKILTTDSEFHSFDRQARRLMELGLADVEMVSAEPFDTLENRLHEKLSSNSYDVFYLSTIFFNSGLGVRHLNELIQAAKPQCQAIILDGYHSFCAVPLDLSSIQDDVFFVAGGYKYAQSGEGVCFMHVPSDTELMPANTGWYASFAQLESGEKDEVGFSNDGQRFAGSTFDPSGLYRMSSVFLMFRRNQLDSQTIHQYVVNLQNHFLNKLEDSHLYSIYRDHLVDCANLNRGHFFAFQLDSNDHATWVAEKMREEKIMVDVRENRVRFGFGIYQTQDDIDELFDRLN